MAQLYRSGSVLYYRPREYKLAIPYSVCGPAWPLPVRMLPVQIPGLDGLFKGDRARNNQRNTARSNHVR